MNLINNVEDLKKAVEFLAEQQRLSHDTETSGPSSVGGLFPFHGSRSFSHIFATKDDEFYFNFNTGGINPKHKILLQPIFDREDRIIFYVNAIYDATISHFDGLVFRNRIIDCPSIARIEYNRHDGGRYAKDESFLSLEYLANYYGVKQKNDLVKQYIKDNDLYYEEKCQFTGKRIPRYDLVPLELMYEYGCDDARSTFDLGTKILKCINFKDANYDYKNKMINVAKNEIKLTSVLLDMKIRGMKLWTEYVEKAMVIEQETSNKLHSEVNKLTGGINLNSGKQLAEYLLSQGAEVPRKTPTKTDLKMIENWEAKAQLTKTDKRKKECAEKIKTYSAGRFITDKKTLQNILKNNPELDFLSKISQAKQADKKLSTYYGNFMKLKDANDIIHCGLNQEKAITGRFSSSEPNFQNLHKEKWDGSEDQIMIRKSIIAKDPDFNLFFMDYKGQEMYIMIDLAEDLPVIKDILENGTDIYVAMGNKVKDFAGIDISRDQAKALSLGVAYGQGKELIAKNLKCSVYAAEQLKCAFLVSLKGVGALNKRMKFEAKRNGRIQNPYGRVSYIDEGFEYKALNSLIQGTAADCTKNAMVNCFELLRDFKSHLILTVHDEVCFEIHKDETHLVPKIAKIMSEAYPHKHLPLKVDIEYSKRSWGEKIKYDNN